MLKISVVEGSNQRRLVLEGRLAAPWTEELKTAYQKAAAELDGRELVIDLINLTTISQQGENLLLELMEQGVRLRGCGVFTKEILKHVARRLHANGGHS
jgi:anti-anti-sigma regulatory factor